MQRYRFITEKESVAGSFGPFRFIDAATTDDHTDSIVSRGKIIQWTVHVEQERSTRRYWKLEVRALLKP